MKDEGDALTNNRFVKLENKAIACCPTTANCADNNATLTAKCNAFEILRNSPDNLVLNSLWLTPKLTRLSFRHIRRIIFPNRTKVWLFVGFNQELLQHITIVKCYVDNIEITADESLDSL